MNKKQYLAIDLKSFYASVECVERGLNPLKTNLVVADDSRTKKTICLAVSPSLKGLGISGRPRLFEVESKIKEINTKRLYKCKIFNKKSYNIDEINFNKSIEVDYIVAKPRMAYYIEYSNRVYKTYLKYVSADDIHIYSIDEVFIDITSYLKIYNKTAHEMAVMMIRDVLKECGVTATAGIGTNLYLAKIAMDIVAKRMPEDSDGVRIAELDEISYRKKMWSHTPITDFWRVGKGYARRLEKEAMFTMGDVARCSIGDTFSYHNEDLLYKMFGKNAELLIDHAWGYEPCTIYDIKKYQPKKSSIGSGQVLHIPYNYESAKLIVWEMVDLLVLELVDKKLATKNITLNITYDIKNLTDKKIREKYIGDIIEDEYGRKIPKPANGSISIDEFTSSSKKIIDAALILYEKIVDKNLLIRKINVSLNNVISCKDVPEKKYEQISLFTNDEIDKNEQQFLEKEKAIQEAMLNLKKKFGKNVVLKATNLKKGATTKKRNNQIGGHKA